MRLLVLLALLVFVSFPALASDAQIVRDVQAVLTRAAQPDGPGVVVLVARGDTVLVRAARGRANLALGVALTPDQTFRIASVTKIFTAALVLQLADQGVLSLDDRIDQRLTGFGDAGRITIRQLL